MDAVKSAITSQPAHWPKTVSLCTMCRTHTYNKLMIGGRRNKRHRKNKKMRSKYQYLKYGPTDFLFSQIKYAPIISVIIKLSGPLLSDWESTYHMLCGVQYHWCTLVAFLYILPIPLTLLDSESFSESSKFGHFKYWQDCVAWSLLAVLQKFCFSLVFLLLSL